MLRSSLLVAFVAVAVLGCDNELPLSPDLPLRLDVSLDRNVLGPTDTVRITLAIRNLARGSVTVRFPSTCWASFEVRSVAGEHVAPLGLMCGAAITYRTFDRGVETVQFVWAGEAMPGSPGRVPPGEYWVVAGLGLPPVAESPLASLRVN